MYEQVPLWVICIILGAFGGLFNILYSVINGEILDKQKLGYRVCAGAGAGYLFSMGFVTGFVNSISQIIGLALVVVPIGYGADDLGEVLIKIIKKKQEIAKSELKDAK